MKRSAPTSTAHRIASRSRHWKSARLHDGSRDDPSVAPTGQRLRGTHFSARLFDENSKRRLPRHCVARKRLSARSRPCSVTAAALPTMRLMADTFMRTDELIDLR
ncbi:hypothetical protein J2W34_006278 [Variovorax boronicumulans]|uniref:hypothetical protein n=1 Tax=Variovorax TaxID=34072 RepID=UPI00278741B8|nr:MULTISPECIES: hypothetical protein [Variovorax]MDQ0074454.1 hypothetical protein [Variovorax boronicumulans]MDQ0608142.1 hypothetical protein [Variovorax sp. W1I1]